MATDPKAATEEPKIDLFEDDDEFEEFEINESKSFRLDCPATYSRFSLGTSV